MSFDWSDIRKMMEQRVPYGDPGTYKFPTDKIVPGDPAGGDADRQCISTFGPLTDFGDNPPCAKGRLQVELDQTQPPPVPRKAFPAPGSAIDEATIELKSFHLKFPSTGADYRITKGFRIPYTYKDVHGDDVHTNLFVLFSGSGQS